MRIRHLNCGSMRPFGGPLVYGRTGGARRLVCHCLLIETEQGLVLVDTGLGTKDVTTERRELGRGWAQLTRPAFDLAETAASQLVELGHRTEDVRHIVLTHLDRDHAGGLRDFPNARVHVHDTEFRTVAESSGRDRYARNQWAHGPDWVVHRSDDGERWFGFDAVRELPGLPPEILLVPLPGHTRGHTGVAVRGDGSPEWLLHAGDAYMSRGEVDPREPACPPGIRAFENLAQVDGANRRRNRDRLRDLVSAHRRDVAVFSAHDGTEFDRHAARSQRVE